MNETNITKILTNVGQYVASYSLGQYVFRKVDDLLWIIEKTAQWSVPYNAIESESTTPAITDSDFNNINNEFVLVRPLPWILFLPSLLVLRFVRIFLNIVALITRSDSITPLDVVEYIQNKRHTLKSIKNIGMKNATHYANLTRLYYNMLSMICFPRLCSAQNHVISRQNTEALIVGKKPCLESDEDNDEDLLAKINKLVNLKSDESNEEEDEETDDTSSSEEVWDETRKSNNLAAEDQTQWSDGSTISSQVIVEENEDSAELTSNSNTETRKQQEHINNESKDSELKTNKGNTKLNSDAKESKDLINGEKFSKDLNGGENLTNNLEREEQVEEKEYRKEYDAKSTTSTDDFFTPTTSSESSPEPKRSPKIEESQLNNHDGENSDSKLSTNVNEHKEDKNNSSNAKKLKSNRKKSKN